MSTVILACLAAGIGLGLLLVIAGLAGREVIGGISLSRVQAASGRGRTVSIAADESRQRKFRALQRSPSGRAQLRQRSAVEHSLAHIAARKGDQARYRGTRKNLFDLRRAATIQNLEGLHRLMREAA